MKYTAAGEPILTDAMKRVILPMAVRDGLVHVNGDELRDKFTPQEASLFKGQDILAVNCTYLGDSLAAIVFFRDAKSAFEEEFDGAAEGGEPDLRRQRSPASSAARTTRPTTTRTAMTTTTPRRRQAAATSTAAAPPTRGDDEQPKKKPTRRTRSTPPTGGSAARRRRSERSADAPVYTRRARV